MSGLPGARAAICDAAASSPPSMISACTNGAEPKPARATDQRNAETVAEAAFAIHDREGEVLDEPRILQAVVENERVCASFDRASRASHPIRPDPALRQFCEHQRFVADHPGGMGVRVDEQRPGALGAAIAPRQEGDASAVADQHPRQRQRGWRLACPADGEIADANRWRAGALATRPHALYGRRP